MKHLTSAIAEALDRFEPQAEIEAWTGFRAVLSLVPGIGSPGGPLRLLAVGPSGRRVAPCGEP